MSSFLKNLKQHNMLGFYFLVGIIYVIINGAIRKIYEEGEFFLVFTHIFLWPFFVILLLITKYPKLMKLKK